MPHVKQNTQRGAGNHGKEGNIERGEGGGGEGGEEGGRGQAKMFRNAVIEL